VEQRIGSSKQPLEGAGLDPAYVPGLTVPGSREPEETAEADTPAAPSPEAATEKAPEPADAEPVAEPEAEADDTGAAEDTAAEVAAEGPVFEAADRRASILANAAGVRLQLDDQECEFRWDEIAAVETAFPRFGKRFTVTVHTPQARWYYVEVEAPSRSRFAEWDKQLDEVLDAYFEEGAEGGESAEGAEDADGAKDAGDTGNTGNTEDA
jgi:hypothetical protein